MRSKMNHFKIMIQLLACCSFLSVVVHAQQNENDPAAITHQTVNDVITDMRANEALYSSDNSKLIAMVEQRLLPRFNFNVMTQLAVARPWTQASNEQKAALQNEFRTLLVRTYSNVLFSKRNVTTTIKSTNTTAQGDVNIDMEVTSSAGAPVKLALRMRADKGDWKVIDVTVGGVSLIATYRTSFTSEISKSGIDGLVASLAEKNRKNME